MTERKVGKVYLVGAGPGDPELVTLKTHRLLNTCDVVVYDNLIPDELIVGLPIPLEKHYVGKRAGVPCCSQDFINELLVRLASEGKVVVRLKGSDPLIFGRGAEEAKFLRAHDIPFEIVPGVTSGLAASAYSGIPCTDRERSSTVILVTGHKAKEKAHTSVDWAWVAKAQHATILVYMGVGQIARIVNRLIINGMSPDTPAAVVERSTFPSQRVFTSSLTDMPDTIKQNNVKAPAIFLVGKVVELRQELDWFKGLPLMGARIMVTRPAAQADPMYTRLRDLGAEVLTYPTIATQEFFDAPAWEKFDAIDTLGRWLIFTSENGVRYFFKQFSKRGVDIRGLSDFKIAVVGSGTARILKEDYNLTADFVPSKMTGKTLAGELVDQEDLKGATVVRVRGNLSYDYVDKAAAEAGAHVIPMTVYETIHPTWPEGLKEKLSSTPPDAVVFTSGSSVDGLYANMTEEEIKRLVAPGLIVSIGPTTSEVIEAYGLEVGLEAKQHNIPDLLDELVEYIQANPIRRNT